MKALKSIPEAADLLGISPWTVRAYVRDGKLRPVRLGRRVLLEEEEIERFVKGNRDGLSTGPPQQAGNGNSVSEARQ